MADILGAREITKEEEQAEAERIAAEKARHAAMLEKYAAYVSAVQAKAPLEERVAALNEVKPVNDADRHAATLKGLLNTALEQVREAAADKEWSYAAQLLDLLANLARGATVRDPISKEGGLSLAFELLSASDALTRTNAYRTIANSIYEHPANRKAAHTMGLLEKAMQAAGEDTDIVAIAAFGTIANLMSEEEEIQHEALKAGVFKTILGKMQSTNREVIKAAGITMLAAIDTDESVKEFLALNGIDEILKLSQTSDHEVADMALASLSILAEDERLRRPLYELKAIDRLIARASDASTPVALQRTITKIIALALTNDENMRSLFEEGRLDLFGKWLTQSTDSDVRAYVALCISNLARKDSYCQAIVQSPVVPPLIEMLGSSDLRQVNGAVGVFRNLALPAANKAPLGEMGLVDRLAPLLNHESAPLRFPVVVVLKNLIQNNVNNATALVAAGGVERLAKAFIESYHDGTKLESARVVVNLLRLRDVTVTRKLTSVSTTYEMLAELIASKHAVLRVEVVATSTLFLDTSAVDDEARARLLHAFAPHIPNVLKNDEDGTKLGLLGFINAVLPLQREETIAARDIIRSETVIEVVKQVASSPSPVAQRAKALLELL